MGAHAFIFRLFFSPSTSVVVPYWSADLIVKTFTKYIFHSPRPKVANVVCLQGTQSLTL
jgi:hypothetical protein